MNAVMDLRGIFLLAAHLLASQEGLCATELVSYTEFCQVKLWRTAP